MKVQHRIELLQRLGEYLQLNHPDWQEAKKQAEQQNSWFTETCIDLAVQQICEAFLQPGKLEAWATQYSPLEPEHTRNVGLVLAGNIPLVGFHDWLCVFMSGHQATIKLSSKDQVLFKHILQKLYGWEVCVQNWVSLSERLKGCDAYIATGSNNSSRYFDFYFAKYPHIIRRNRTSVAILTGNESPEQLTALAADIHQYFGLGCRNVTKIYVPEGYDFLPFIEACKSYRHFIDHHKYKSNFDYHLSILIMNNKYYMSSGSLVLVEAPAYFSPVGQLHYEYYTDRSAVLQQLNGNENIQCIVGEQVKFGAAQYPSLSDYADGVDTMQFLTSL
jgi:hypothetical protein